jgi:peptide/nickel transport system permease protein
MTADLNATTAAISPDTAPEALDTAVSTPPDQPRLPRASRRGFRKRGRFTKWFAVVWLVLLTFTAIGANWLPYVKHDCSQYAKKLDCSTYLNGSPIKLERPPAWAGFSESKKPSTPTAPPRVGWFGTDTNGFDIFSRAMFGARNSLLIGALSILFGLIVGSILGLLAGFIGGKLDRVIDTVMNVLLAFPALLLAIFIVGFFSNSSAAQAENRSIGPVIIALSILSVPPLTRLMRANTLVYAQREFVTAARSIGASRFRIMVKEILPNVVPTMLTFALTGMAILIVAEGALAYLGLSVNSPTPTWGSMIASGQTKLKDAWWIAIMPAATMFITILCINLLGDVLSERFRIRETIG